jgi:predicted Zn-dependent peptidase
MVKIHTLKNGLRIIVDEMKDVQSCTVAIGCGTGSFNETKEENGISHFLEHMAFKGTKKRTAFDIAHEVDAFGGYMNAFTSNERTVYYIKCLANHLPKSMDILADILLNSTFKKAELERERGVILQELAATLDTPDDVVFDYYKEATYGDTPYGRTILGPAENIKSLQKENFTNYMKNQYVPSNMVVSVAGNVKSKDVIKMAEEYFGKISDSKMAQDTKKPKYIGGEVIKKNKSLTQTQFVLGFESISIHDKNYYVSAVSAAVLGLGMSSRLFQNIREKLGLCYTISCFSENYKHAGLFSIYCGTSPKDISKLEKAIEQELEKATQDISKAELSKILEQYKSTLLFGNESTSSRAQKGISNLLTFDRYLDAEEIIANVEKIQTTDVQNFIGKIIKAKRTKVVYGNV